MKPILAEIITIGDELLYGQITDTNSQWISEQLATLGIKTIRKTTVGDVMDDILHAFKQAEEKADLILITGGLGPTSDDLTKPALANYFSCGISLHEGALQELTELFESRGYQLNDRNREQAFLPDDCELVSNRHGTAPGMWFERNGKVFVSMPGVPFEMKAMISNEILPKVKMVFRLPVIHHKMIMTAGIGESWLADKIRDIEEGLPKHISLAYLPGLSQVRLRLTGIGEEKESLIREIENEADKLKAPLKPYLYGYNNDPLEKVIGELMIQKGISIATAESCTGGYVAHRITSIPGSSAYFNGGTIPYQNEIKINLLGVSKETLKEHGAVSEQTVIEMAVGARKKFNSDIAVSSSGIAGPGGGTSEKPVGTVWICYADKDNYKTRKLQLGNLRDINIQRTANAILFMVWQSLTENDREK